jgi:hypothetical protein
LPEARGPGAEPSAERRTRAAAAPAPRYQPDPTHIQFDFGGPADRAAERRRAMAILGLVAVAAVGLLTALAYLAGPLAAAVAALAAAALIGFGNWVLDNTVDL